MKDESFSSILILQRGDTPNEPRREINTMTNEKMMKEALMWKLLLSMSVPVVLVTLMMVVYNMADIFFMGMTGATMQVAAVKLAGPAFSIIQAFNTLLGMGGCTAIAMALGRKDLDAAKKYSSFSVWAGVGIGVVLMAVVMLFTNPLVRLMGADAATAGYTATYMRILALGAPFMVTGGALGNVVRADGSTAKAALGSIVGTITNIALDPLFILVFKWGIAGAAVATVLGNVVTLVYCVIIMRKSENFSLSPKYLSLKKDVSLKVIGYGVPMAAGTLLMSFSSIFSNNLMMKHGPIAIAAQGVAGMSSMLICMVIMGVCMGIQPAISYAHGAGDRRRVRQIVRGTGIASVLLGTVLALVFFIFRDGFVAGMLNDPEVIELGKRMIIGSLITMPIYGVYQMSSTYLQATGKVSYATLVSLLRQGIVFIPIIYTMNALLGLNGLIFAGAVADVIATVVGVVLSIVWARKLASEPKMVESVGTVETAA